MKTEALHKTVEEAHWNLVGSVRPLSVNPVVRAFRRMAVLRSLHLVVLWAAVSFSMAFNIDVAEPKIYNGSGPREDFFGYKALHFQSGTEKGFVVSAPLQRNGTGGVFICDDTSPDCKPVLLPNAAEFNSEGSIKAVGMSVAVRATPTLQFTACSPAWSHECDGTPYLNSICYQWNRSSLVSNITSAFKECTKQKVDLVFLFDGSLSMKPEDWKKNKEFIKTIMNSMSNTSIQFAAVQFSKVSRTVFTFKDYQDNKAFKKLDDEEHMKSLTNTHGAMHYALTNLFDESESGRHPDATKVVVIITDGNPSDSARVRVNGTSRNIVEIYEDRHIMRFVIGVGAEVKMDKLRLLASEPKFDNSFYIGDYAGLTGLLDNLQTKIFNIEERTKQNVDLVFLFDGSLSMKNEDFVKNKEFIKTIMKSMSNTSIQFAAVQFSKVSRTVFTFKDYQDNKAFKKLDDEQHMKSMTNTHGAMHYTLTNLFDESESGRHPDATKVVVIITDGYPCDSARVNGTSKNIVEIYEDRHIMRFVIGVGNEIKMDKLRLLASEPKFNNSFYIDDYSGLAGLLDNLQKKIFNIESSTCNPTNL